MSYKTDKGFLNVAVSGQDTVSADEHTDTLTLVAGTNVSITTDASADSVTISSSASGGGGSSSASYAVLNARGYAKVASSSYLYAHVWDGVSVPGQWTQNIGSAPSSAASGDTISVTVMNGMLYMGLWQIPADAEAVSLSASWYQAFGALRTRVRLWKCTPGDNSTTSQTWTAIGSGAINATAGSYRTHTASEDFSSDSNRTVSAGDVLAITFDGKNIDGSNYSSSNSNNRATFQLAVQLEWS